MTSSRIYLYINSGRSGPRYLWHIPSTFATVNTHANVFFVFLPGGISKEWRHIVSANCHFDRQSLPCLGNVYRPFGQDRADPKNSSRVIMTSGVCEGMLAPPSFCWPNLGCESPLAETPKGSLGREEGCTFLLPLWSSNRREAGET